MDAGRGLKCPGRSVGCAIASGTGLLAAAQPPAGTRLPALSMVTDSGSLERVVDEAVDKLLQTFREEAVSALRLKALQDENAQLREQLRETERVDDEEMDQLWALVGRLALCVWGVALAFVVKRVCAGGLYCMRTWRRLLARNEI